MWCAFLSELTSELRWQHCEMPMCTHYYLRLLSFPQGTCFMLNELSRQWLFCSHWRFWRLTLFYGIGYVYISCFFFYIYFFLSMVRSSVYWKEFWGELSIAAMLPLSKKNNEVQQKVNKRVRPWRLTKVVARVCFQSDNIIARGWAL